MTKDFTQPHTLNNSDDSASQSDSSPVITIAVVAIMLFITIAILIVMSKPLNTSPDQEYDPQKVAGVLED